MQSKRGFDRSRSFTFLEIVQVDALSINTYRLLVLGLRNIFINFI